MAEHTRPRPTWALRELELLQERLNAALLRRLACEETSMAIQIQAVEIDRDIADFRRQVAGWKTRHGLEEVTP